MTTEPFSISPDMDITTYYKTISAKGKVVMKQKQAEGKWMNRPPLGYRMVRKNGDAFLEPDPATYPLVQEARTLRAKGATIDQVLAVMTEKGLRSRNGKPLSRAGMWVVLTTPDHNAPESPDS